MVSKNASYASAAGIIIIIIIAATVYTYHIMPMTKTETPNVTATLFAGPSGSKYGFGNSSATITSPGPSLVFLVNDTVKMTLYNSDSAPMQHGWQIVNSLNDLTVQFEASIDPINAGTNANVIFSIDKAGNFTYICQVPGHIQLGMWGNVTVLAAGV